MASVFADFAISLDGYIAGPNAKPGNPLGDGGPRVQEWVYRLASWREALGLPGGERNADDDLVRHTIERAGAHVMGRRMFDEGELGWPENAPFHKPVFVVTHRAREPWVRTGGTTFHFVTDGITSALEQARAAAGDKDVRVSGGADVFQQLFRAGLIDELTVHIAPVMIGGGVRLFESLGPDEQALEATVARVSQLTTHVSYRVAR
jgi:dihydrofolate reductase